MVSMTADLDLSGLADSQPLTEEVNDLPGETPEDLIARGVIPEGYIRDPKTKEIRPRKRRGRRAGTAAPRPETPLERGEDEKPDSKARGKRKQPVPRYQKGVVAAGMTKLYKRTGRIVKAIDRPIGIAIVECAEDCGEAWDELARTNPNVRRTLMKLISGGAWGAVIMAHAPIAMAIIMKDGIRKHIPFMRLIEGVMEDANEGDDDEGIGGLLKGMTREDMQQMMNVAQGMMGGMAARAAQNGADE